MDWEQARRRSLRRWRAIEARLGKAHPRDLLAEINAVFALCETAREVDPSRLVPCDNCPFQEQFGGCRGISLAVNERVAAREWEAARRRVRDLIDRLERLDLTCGGSTTERPAAMDRGALEELR